MINGDEGGQLSDFIGGGHRSYEGGHKAHRGGSPQSPPLGKTLIVDYIQGRLEHMGRA